jgi:hypothetical protein
MRKMSRFTALYERNDSIPRNLNSPITKSYFLDLVLKIKSLVLPKNMSLRPVLIHVNGVDEYVQESDFFSSIIDFNDLLQKH